ncbi:hydroxyacylglutathione hydrolase [Croceibacterium mercuriale]|uniref:Hydroxyacylglutathione hydrolase n=1 Tax=Croceibacterium mercuriale TaxID=1572751 RepID=A0A0B2C0H6_9SPHN|nr:hydroxyacylglutathione hydrolase [Croceibacterium mercuriale]KHL25742.1 hydroxyacylglutathione hydrolase [Croceibacterium mercuriale]
MTLQLHTFPALTDNYGFLLHDPASEETACIDTPDGAECLRQAEAKGWRITQVWNTHWHADHTQGNLAVKSATGCTVIAPAEEAHRIEGVDRTVGPGNTLLLGEWQAEVFAAGGHTLGHIAYHLPAATIAFVGDCLFALGCGRMFEGTPDQFWASLQRIAALPQDTTICGAHEYSAGNARFALHADPDNLALQDYAREITAKRAAGEPTVPFRLERELATNPFLRADQPALQARWGGGDAVATFAALRAAKDAY